MTEFSGILFTLKKREQNITSDDSPFYKYIVLGYYDGLDINTIDKWYDLRPKGLLERSLQVDLNAPFIDQYTIRTFIPSNSEELDKQGFSYAFWKQAGEKKTHDFDEYEKELRKRYPFICMSVLNLTERFVKQQDNLQMIQDRLIDALKKHADDSKYNLNELHCAVFPSLGYSDFIILFLTDDLTKAADIINQLRDSVTEDGTTLISGCYSVCGLDKCSFDAPMAGDKENVKISIRLNLKEGISARDFLDYLNNEMNTGFAAREKQAEELEKFIEEVNKSYYVTFGNSDCLLLPEQYLEVYLKWYVSGHILNPGNKFFQEYIADVRTSVRIMGESCTYTGNFHSKTEIDLQEYEDKFKRFIETYEDFLKSHNFHIRSSRAIQQLMKNFLNVARTSHGFDVKKIVGDAFLSLIEVMEYFISLKPEDVSYYLSEEKKAEYVEKNQNRAVLALEEFKDYIGLFLSDLIRSDRPFIEGNVLTHSSIGSATKLLFAYSAMLEMLTVKQNKSDEFVFVVSSGGCDQTSAIEVFPFISIEVHLRKPVIIMIPEMSLYDVQGTMFRILHEYMHFIGDRRRKARYRYIVNAMSRYIAWEIVSMHEQRLDDLFPHTLGQLTPNMRDEVEDKIKRKRQYIARWKAWAISNAISRHEYFAGYRESKDEAYYSEALKDSVFNMENVVDIFSVSAESFEDEKENCLQKQIYNILYNSEKRLIEETVSVLKQLRENKGDTYDGRSAIMPLQSFRILQHNYEFRCKNPRAYDRKLKSFIEQYIESLFRNYPLKTGARELFPAWYGFDRLLQNIMFAFIESFSDCCAAYTVDMREAEFLLSFIYEVWNIDHAFHDSMENILRLGADIQVLYGTRKRLGKDTREAVWKKVKERKKQGYIYRNVDQMLDRVDDLLRSYYSEELKGIRIQLEKYLKECTESKDEWYSEELGGLYRLCDMDTSDKVYTVADYIICLWKNLGGEYKEK